MDRHCGHAGGLQRFGKLHAVAAAHVPAPAELGGDGDVYGFHHSLHNAAGLLRVFHQRGAVAVVDDLCHGAAHVDVDDVRPGVLQGDLGGLRHADGVAAEDLHRRGMLTGKLLQQGKCLFIAIAQGLGGDQLRDGVTRAQLGTDLAEGHIGHAGHRCQCQAGFDLHVSDIHIQAPFHKNSTYHTTASKKSPPATIVLKSSCSGATLKLSKNGREHP